MNKLNELWNNHRAWIVDHVKSVSRAFAVCFTADLLIEIQKGGGLEDLSIEFILYGTAIRSLIKVAQQILSKHEKPQDKKLQEKKLQDPIETITEPPQ